MNTNIKIFIITFLSILITVISLFIGSHSINIYNIFNSESIDNYIFFNTRLQRVITGFITGGILAVSGLVFQSIFKNPIATPFTLGVAGGASLGAAIYILFAQSISLMAVFGQTIAALIGAVITILIVYSFAFIKGRLNNITLLLAGVAVNFFTSSLIMFIQYFADIQKSYNITRYITGSLAAVSLNNILFLTPLSLAAFIIIYSYHKELDIISMGEYTAKSRGVNITSSITILYFTVSLSIATVVSATGPIGFVGMIIPHIIRMYVSFKNKILIPVSFIFGGAFLVLCDTVSRVIIAPAELPVSVVTSLIGAPFFIFLIMKTNKL